jgi:hypothetical protein
MAAKWIMNMRLEDLSALAQEMEDYKLPTVGAVTLAEIKTQIEHLRADQKDVKEPVPNTTRCEYRMRNMTQCPKRTSLMTANLVRCTLHRDRVGHKRCQCGQVFNPKMDTDVCPSCIKRGEVEAVRAEQALNMAQLEETVARIIAREKAASAAAPKPTAAAGKVAEIVAAHEKCKMPAAKK